MPKETRLTIRINESLDLWLAEQAELNGLDKAAYARMVLFRAMNGVAEQAPQQPEQPAQSAAAFDDGPQHGTAADVDDMVAQRLAEAEAGGRLVQGTHPVEELDPALAELGMRPFRLAPPPHFGDKSPRIQRSSTWAPGGR